MVSPELSARAAAAVQRAIAIGLDTYEARGDLAEAFVAVDWPSPAPSIMPLAAAMTPAQLALVRTLAAQPTVDLAFMKIANVRLARWISSEPPGILERIVPERGVPLWRVVRELEEARTAGELRRFLSTMSIADRLEAFGEVNAFGYEKPYRLEDTSFFDYGDLELLHALRDEGKVWAPRFADQLLTHDRRPRPAITWPVFLALVRAGISIEPRWDTLLPLGFGVYRDLTDEVVAAIHAERRDAAIVGAVGMSTPYAVGLPLLEKFPSAALTRLLLDPKDGPPAAIVKEVKRIAKNHPVVATALEAMLANAPQPVALSIARVIAPSSASELSPSEQVQLAKAGEMWDGHALTAAERLSANGEETSFAGHVELRSLVGADGSPAYDAWLYMVDSGVIFVAGTQQVAAEIIQRGLECSDRALRDGLSLVLVGAGKQGAKAGSKRARAAKKPAAKKPAAKKPAAKKPAAKKPAAKKPAAKKPAAKTKSR